MDTRGGGYKNINKINKINKNIHFYDLTLLSPSIKGLQKMVKMCAKFGREFSVKYNPGKSKCMVLSRCRRDMAHVNIVLGSKSLMWVDSIKYLGNFIATKLAEEPEIRKKQSHLISRINSLLYKFGYTDSQVLMKLFVSKCCHLYGCESWNFNQAVLERIMITWNKAVRRIWGLPQDSRTMLLAGLNQGKHAWDIIFNRFIGMVYNMVRSKNEKLSLIALSGLEDMRSIIAQNVDKIRRKWKIRGNIVDIAKMKDKCAIYKDKLKN